MKHFIGLLTWIILVSLPGRAGTTVSIHIGGYGGHGCYGGSYGGYPRCSYAAYGYGPYYSNYQVLYASPVYYGDSFYSANDVPAPTPTVYSPPSPPVTAPAVNPVSGPLPTGILDVNGYVHSPYTGSIFKIPHVINGQKVFDPVTGQPFRVR